MGNVRPSGKQNGFKERVRKMIVSLKRRPHIIPLIILALAFLYYSLNLTKVSDTTAKIQGANMGLSQFSAMLFSMLSMVCFMNSFPHRKKVNVPMLVLMFALVGVVLLSDVIYYRAIVAALTRANNPIVIANNTMYIVRTQAMLRVHMVMLGVFVVVTALLPVIGKLLRRINTSVSVDENENMHAIELED